MLPSLYPLEQTPSYDNTHQPVANRLPPISQLKTRMRQLVWQETIQDVVKRTHDRSIIRRLEELLAA